jgi:hypothetical protein
LEKQIKTIIYWFCIAFIVSCVVFGTKSSKYKEGECLKGSSYYYKVHRVWKYHYDLKLVDTTLYLQYNQKVVDKAFTKVNCVDIGEG